MAVWFDPSNVGSTQELTANILHLAKQGERVQFLVDPGNGLRIVQRMRVALSRSRRRNLDRGKSVDEFTLYHDVYPYTSLDGKRHDCIVVWIEKSFHHRKRELLDDLLKRV